VLWKFKYSPYTCGIIWDITTLGSFFTELNIKPWLFYLHSRAKVNKFKQSGINQETRIMTQNGCIWLYYLWWQRGIIKYWVLSKIYLRTKLFFRELFQHDIDLQLHSSIRKWLIKCCNYVKNRWEGRKDEALDTWNIKYCNKNWRKHKFKKHLQIKNKKLKWDI